MVRVSSLIGLLLLSCTRAPDPRPVAAAPRAPVSAPPAPPRAGPTLPSGRPHALQLLSRFTFGARPGDVERVLAMGSEAWVARQLEPSKIDDAGADRALASYRDVLAPPGELP